MWLSLRIPNSLSTPYYAIKGRIWLKMNNVNNYFPVLKKRDFVLTFGFVCISSKQEIKQFLYIVADCMFHNRCRNSYDKLVDINIHSRVGNPKLQLILKTNFDIWGVLICLKYSKWASWVQCKSFLCRLVTLNAFTCTK